MSEPEQQRGTPPESAAPPAIVEERRITDLDTLRMLADPLRLAVLGAMPQNPAAPPVTVKEIAEKLDEGQTKLYRHVKQLEEAGLVVVAETRVVSGIIEKRYRAAQHRLTVDGDVLRTIENTEALNDTIVAVLDATRRTLEADLRAGRVVLDHPQPADEAPREGADADPAATQDTEQVLDLALQSASVRTWMQPEKFVRVRDALNRLIEELGPRDEGPGAIPVVIQTLMYTSGEPQRPDPA